MDEHSNTTNPEATETTTQTETNQARPGVKETVEKITGTITGGLDNVAKEVGKATGAVITDISSLFGFHKTGELLGKQAEKIGDLVGTISKDIGKYVVKGMNFEMPQAKKEEPTATTATEQTPPPQA
jgi:hypothetical protein